MAASEFKSKADQIRALAAEGLKPSEIAKVMNIRYQHAYHVLKRSMLLKEAVSASKKLTKKLSLKDRPELTADILLSGGFQKISRWTLMGDVLCLDKPVSKDVGVYAFVKDGTAQYVGVATMGLSKRLYFYGKPGISQRTSLRLNAVIKSELLCKKEIEVYAASPPDLDWKGMPVHGCAGLELGLIKKYALPWNKRSSG